jgi:hypothetical protein
MPAWLTARFWSQGHRSPSSAWGGSALVHLGGLLLLSTLWTTGTNQTAPAPVDLRWEAEPLSIDTLGMLPQVASLPADELAGGRRAGHTSSEDNASHSSALPLRVVGPLGINPLLLSEILGSQLAGRGLGEEVGPLEPSDGEDGLGGDGGGDGTGSGKGSGRFFGVRPKGTSIVYVLDCSRSMNHPDNTEAKTRFRRLKLELVKAIGGMPPESQFFIVFFSDDAFPMPAGTMVYATDAQKQRQLSWLAQMKADGETDPRRALGMALRMKPDVICFLTDGSFDRPIERDVLRISQKDTVIHTFAFGNETKIDALKELAKKNGGKFHFIP